MVDRANSVVRGDQGDFRQHPDDQEVQAAPLLQVDRADRVDYPPRADRVVRADRQ